MACCIFLQRKENFNDLYTIKPETAEGIFISADYTVLETENMAKLPPFLNGNKITVFAAQLRPPIKKKPSPWWYRRLSRKANAKQLAKYTLEDIVAVLKTGRGCRYHEPDNR